MLNGRIVDGHLTLTAEGAWTAAHARALEALIDGVQSEGATAGSLALDMSGVQALDTFGAWLVERLVRNWRSRNQDAQVVGLAEPYRGLLDNLEAANSWTPPPPVRENPVVAALAALGRSVADSGRGAIPFLDMLGAFGAVLARTVQRPRSFRFTSFVHHLDRVGLQAVPIILLITFLIGGIIAQQGIFHFRKFGADVYVVDMVGILVLREIGVLIVAIMVAGRSGSSYTAELGSMKMREEVDALRTMGLDPVEVLILPRILALMVALPLLTFLGSMAALYGGGLVAWLYGGMSPDIFITRLKEAISLTHFKVGMIKAPFMALAIGVVACSEGLRVKGSAESLGTQTTTSVVKSIFLVIVLDGVFAIFFASINM
ncbi:MAG TPA: MlaE family lipid ABC transporter permease subunit [Hyphomicrobiaceae bacterium]|nr:MlaE family lipid ABC transporter permease subunit [Hyphomicrobiaceae bacterium]